MTPTPAPERPKPTKSRSLENTRHHGYQAVGYCRIVSMGETAVSYVSDEGEVGPVAPEGALMRKLGLLLAGLTLIVIACGGDEEVAESTTTVIQTPTTTLAGTTTTTTTLAGATETTPEPEDTPTTTTAATPDLTSDSKVTLRALGPVRIGMSVEEASSAAGIPLLRDTAQESTGSCYYVTAGSALRGVSFMVVEDLIARIDIDAPSSIATRSGVRIGTAADGVRAVYTDNIQSANSAVADGEALAFVPNDDFDADFRIYFEIVDGLVARYRLGVKPAVDFLAGCAEA